MWDVAAKLAGVPLYRLLADRYNDGRFDTRVEVYAAGGYYYPDEGTDRLAAEMRGYLDSGYTHLKMKIGGASLDEDMARIETVLEARRRRGAGSPSTPTADSTSRRRSPTVSGWRRTACAGTRRRVTRSTTCSRRELAATTAPPFATAENLFSHEDVRNLLRYAGLRPADGPPPDGSGPELRHRRARAHARRHARRRLEPAQRCIPHGGHLMALHMAAGLQLGGNESYPGIFQPFGGFGEQHEVVDGVIDIAGTPGIGLEHKPELQPTLAELVPEAFA